MDKTAPLRSPKKERVMGEASERFQFPRLLEQMRRGERAAEGAAANNDTANHAVKGRESRV
jgi:hypothetical protein